MRLRLGTRGSALALRQSGMVAGDLRALGHEVELVVVTTPGDVNRDPLPGRAQEGLFTSSLRDALDAGVIDLAIHSCKDLPVDAGAPAVIAAVPRREDPRDALVSGGFPIAALPPGARIGTCSVRRAAWVHRTRPDALVVPVRGNIDDRIAQRERGDFDAIVLAVAGLRRLGREDAVSEAIDVRDLVPAPAQGALAIQARDGDRAVHEALAALDHAATRLAVAAERAVLASIDPTDSTAVGALAIAEAGTLRLIADLARPDGSDRRVVELAAPVAGERDAEELGREAARALGGILVG